MAGVVAFMESPLVTWVKTFNESGEYVIDFEDLTDGVFLNDVLLQIDERDVGDSCEIQRSAKDNNALIQNWMLLLKHIRSFYQDFLQQTIVLAHPQILSIVKEPTKETSLLAIERVLLLLLGCAVQCQNKELYIHRIKQLDLPTQQAIVAYIQKITEEDGEHVVRRSGDGKGVLQAVTHERDHYAQTVLQLTQERDYYKADAESKRGGGGQLTPPPGLEQYHLVRQLAHANNSINTLTTDLEDKSRLVGELKDEIESLNKDLYTLKAQNLALSKDAKTSHAYRDEVDTYKEKALKVDALEKEVTKLKEKLNEFDFYKTRVEELRSDVSGLTEQRDMLEEQLTGLQRTHRLVMEDLLSTQHQISSAISEKESTQKKLEELMEEHTSLQLELSKIQENKFRPLISYASSESLSGSQLLLTGHPISEELKDCMSNGMMQLEMERDELQHDLEDTKQRLANTQRELDTLKKTTSDAKKRLTESQTQTDPAKSEPAKPEPAKPESSKPKPAKPEPTRPEPENPKCPSEKRESEHDRLKRETELKLQYKEELVQKMRTEFEQRIRKVKSDLEAEKQAQQEHLDRTIARFEKEKTELRHQIESYKESWQSEKDNYKKLETLNKDLISEKYQFKTTIEAIRKNSESCIKELEKEVQALQIQADNAASLVETGECRMCRRENNQEGVQHVMAEIERQYPHLIYPQEPAGISRSRPSSGRFKHASTPPPGNVSRSMQSLPVQVSYVEGPPSNPVTPQKREMSSSSKSVGGGGNNGGGDILRPNSLRRSGRPASVMGLAGERERPRGSPMTPQQQYQQQQQQQAQQQQQRRSHDPSPSRFFRGDKKRSTVIGRGAAGVGVGMKGGLPIMETFSRNDHKRRTMPEKRGGYTYHPMTPGTQGMQTPGTSGTQTPSTPGTQTPKAEFSSLSSHTLVSQDTLYLQQAFMSQHGTPVTASNPSRIFSGTNPDQEAHVTRISQQQRSDRIPSNGYSSDRDSGFATSPNSPESMGDASRELLSNLSSTNAEAIRNSFKTSGGKVSEKWRLFVDKIVELQDKNQQLTLDHADMKKKYNAVKFNEDRISHIEKKNVDLEAENKKLRKIVESLQSQLSVGNPYDPREYHFYTNV